jgi:hypothetical protein
LLKVCSLPFAVDEGVVDQILGDALRRVLDRPFGVVRAAVDAAGVDRPEPGDVGGSRLSVSQAVNGLFPRDEWCPGLRST